MIKWGKENSPEDGIEIMQGVSDFVEAAMFIKLQFAFLVKCIFLNRILREYWISICARSAAQYLRKVSDFITRLQKVCIPCLGSIHIVSGVQKIN